jgi:phosphatidylserine/phosphatidylglycerophosphate/cardiolipin synthase-like enzyme
MSDAFQVTGNNPEAKFTLKLHRGDGMALVAMDWKNGTPPNDFVGFGIEYREPDGDRFFALKNRLNFPKPDGSVDKAARSTLLSPIQMFRWVHFPRNANLEGTFRYRVTPMFMNSQNELSQGAAEEVDIELRRETFPGKLNVTFTRGFVSSQAFVDRYASAGPISKLVAPKAAEGLNFVPTHPKKEEALAWMGFEAREAIMSTLDEAIADAAAEVFVVAYDLNEPVLVDKLKQLGNRLKIIIDDSADHGEDGAAENQAAEMLGATAGAVKRQRMASLQHNKTIVVDGPALKKVVCGSTNFSWRGFFVQSNNAMVLTGETPVKVFREAFENYFANPDNDAEAFGNTNSAKLHDLGLGIDAKVAFSPHVPTNALLKTIADDIQQNTTSSLFYSLAFLHQTPGVIRDAIKAVSHKDNIFVYGIADKEIEGGLELQKPDGNVEPVFASALAENLPEPFNKEPTGGNFGTRMHHKFVVIDFDKATARVYLGSYNFSKPADKDNGENLLIIRDRRVAVTYMIEALRIFDHYHFRILQQDAATAVDKLQLKRPPKGGEKAWWDPFFTDPRKIRDRKLFA